MRPTACVGGIEQAAVAKVACHLQSGERGQRELAPGEAVANGSPVSASGNLLICAQQFAIDLVEREELGRELAPCRGQQVAQIVARLKERCLEAVWILRVRRIELLLNRHEILGRAGHMVREDGQFTGYETAFDQPLLEDLDQDIEDGTGERHRQVMRLGHGWRIKRVIEGDSDFSALRKLANAIELVLRE